MPRRAGKGLENAIAKRGANRLRNEEETRRIEGEIARISSLSVEDLRNLWRQEFGRGTPAALSEDLMIRMLCFRLQEEVYGGLDRTTLKRLRVYAEGKTEGVRQAGHLKPGTELIREYLGQCLKVIVTENGFVFDGKNYPSLTSIARSVTGTNWNGPKFFGLRTRADGATRRVIPRVGDGDSAHSNSGASV